METLDAYGLTDTKESQIDLYVLSTPRDCRPAEIEDLRKF